MYDVFPYDVLPPEPRQYDPMDDSHFWAGPVEAELPPEDVDLWEEGEDEPDDKENKL
jgi:hypothetical protein